MWRKRFFEERQAWCASWMIARHAAQGGPALASTLSALPQAVFSHVDAELDGLSAILREAIVLRYLRGFSEQEAATQAACPLGTMKRRASDGLAKLRARLSKRGVALSGVALAGLLTSEASAAIPETLLPSILAAVKTALPAVALGAKEGALSKMLSKYMIPTRLATIRLRRITTKFLRPWFRLMSAKADKNGHVSRSTTFAITWQSSER